MKPTNKLLRSFVGLCLTFLPMSQSFAQVGAMPIPAEGNQAVQEPSIVNSQDDNSQGVSKSKDTVEDHLAHIFEFKGDVKIMKKEAGLWMTVEKGMVIESGDQILTGEGAYLDVVYDPYFLNIARIEAGTRAQFRSIEPTELVLEEGMIFNALDGLKGHSYQIATPTAVAAVRGTTFDIGFNPETNITTTLVYPDQSDHLGQIVIDPVQVELPSQTLVEGQKFDETVGAVVAIPETELVRGQEMMQAFVADEKVAELRAEGMETVLPESENVFDNTSASETETGLDQPSDDQKNIGGNGPNDGGDQGLNDFNMLAGNEGPGVNLLKSQGNDPSSEKNMAGLSGTADALIDSAVFSGPSGEENPIEKTEVENDEQVGSRDSTAPASNTATGTRSRRSNVDEDNDTQNTDGSVSVDGPSSAPATPGSMAPRGDVPAVGTFSGAMQFMALGSDQVMRGVYNPGTTGTAATDPADYAARIAGYWGMPAPAAAAMGSFFATTTATYTQPLNSHTVAPMVGPEGIPGSAAAGMMPPTGAAYAPGMESGDRYASMLAAAMSGGGSMHNYDPAMSHMMTGTGGTWWSMNSHSDGTMNAGMPYMGSAGAYAPGTAPYDPAMGGTAGTTGGGYGYTAPGGYNPAPGTGSYGYVPPGGYTAPGDGGYGYTAPGGYNPVPGTGSYGYVPPGGYTAPGDGGYGYTAPGGYNPAPGTGSYGYVPPGGYTAPGDGGYGYVPPGGYTAPGDGGYGYVPPGGYTAPGDGGYGYVPPGGYTAPGDGGYGYVPPGGYTAPGDGGYGYVPPGGYIPPGDSYVPPGGYTPPPGEYYVPPAEPYFDPTTITQDATQSGTTYVAPTGPCVTDPASCTAPYNP